MKAAAREYGDTKVRASYLKKLDGLLSNTGRGRGEEGSSGKLDHRLHPPPRPPARRVALLAPLAALAAGVFSTKRFLMPPPAANSRALLMLTHLKQAQLTPCHSSRPW